MVCRYSPPGDISPGAILPEPIQTEDRTLEVYRDVPVDTFYIAWHMGARNDKSFYAADLLSDILSNGKITAARRKLVKEKTSLPKRMLT